MQGFMDKVMDKVKEGAKHVKNAACGVPGLNQVQVLGCDEKDGSGGGGEESKGSRGWADTFQEMTNLQNEHDMELLKMDQDFQNKFVKLQEQISASKGGPGIPPHFAGMDPNSRQMSMNPPGTGKFAMASPTPPAPPAPLQMPK